MNRKYRKTILAANFKMHKTPSQVREYAIQLRNLMPRGRWCDIVICPAMPSIYAATRGFRETRIAVGAQNVHAAPAGAFTGESSVEMLQDLSVRYVILGHSERRALGETDAEIRQKLEAVLAGRMTPILCVGESLQEREQGIALERIAIQLKLALQGLTAQQLRSLVIAYEPIWAIGTGKTAQPEEAQEVCQAIRTILRKLFDAKTARGVSILYGGSMNAKNAWQLLAQPDVDGGLIGSASLDPAEFVQIIEAANQ